jgi:hypothetical protein
MGQVLAELDKAGLGGLGAEDNLALRGDDLARQYATARFAANDPAWLLGYFFHKDYLRRSEPSLHPQPSPPVHQCSKLN